MAALHKVEGAMFICNKSHAIPFFFKMRPNKINSMQAYEFSRTLPEDGCKQKGEKSFPGFMLLCIPPPLGCFADFSEYNTQLASFGLHLWDAGNRSKN